MAGAKQDSHVAHGLVALRKRFVRRAEVLATHDQFKAACLEAQLEWNRKHKRYRVPGKTGDSGVPLALARDYPTALAEFQRAESAYAAHDQEASAKDQLDDLMASLERRAQNRVLAAFDDWQDAVWQLADRFFLPEDFPVLAGGATHPAAAFLGCAMASASMEHLRDRVDALIDTKLDVLDALGFEVEQVLALGLYPGVTAKDIEQAAPQIAERANMLYAERMPIARIRTLRAEGRKQREIGDRLGLSERAVGDALRDMKA